MNTKNSMVNITGPGPLLSDLRQLIDATRQQTTTAVNVGLTLLYWRVGQRINAEVLRGERASYGEQTVATVSQQLTIDYGRSFGSKNLRHMMRFAEVFPEESIVYALSRHLSWTHFRALLYLDKPFQRDFYAEMCRLEGWSTRVLAERIDSMLYERTALSRKPDDLIRQELATLRSKSEVAPTLVLKDPYLLDFLGLNDRFLERDLEDAILRENPPLGIILCAGKNSEQIELLELSAAGIHVAEYLTVLPPPDVLQRQLHRAIETARARIDAKGTDIG